MDAPAVSLARKMAAGLLAFALAFSMAPAAWADDGPAGTLAGAVAGNASDTEAPEGGADEGVAASGGTEAPEAKAQSAEAKAADSAGSAPGTTIKIAVYRSSYPLVWDLNDEGSADVTKAQWDKPAAWPTEGSPGSAVGAYAGYTEADEPTRTGFAFLGWSAVADDPTVAGKLDALEIPKGTEPVEGSDGVKSITLHALWAPIEYSVVFDLTKNPEDASAVPSFNWTTGKGTFTDLGAGRYRLSGVTLEDYDPERGLIEIATPSRGTGGYRFLSWAEPESQQSPTVAMQPAGISKWYVNPVALTHYDYEPVLTARWSLSFDVDVPSQITFDQYDSIEVEGSLTDTTDENVVDKESDDRHDAGKMAHFCSQSTATDYKIVALKSEMQPTASDILTTSDSSKASQEQVLNDEKLLSLFAANDASESAGVHFKLTDSIDMDDSSRYGAFVIPKQTKAYSDADYSRDDEERLYVSYRLNLSNKVDGSSEPNHGLVTPANVNEGDRTPIAKVSYEFAVADHETETTIPGDPFYITDADGTTYGLDYIKAAADDIAANGESSRYYAQFKGYLDSGMDPGTGDAEGFVEWGDGITYNVRIIGINHDDRADGAGKAGLTFQFTDCLKTPYRHRTSNTNTGGWGSSLIKASMYNGDIYKAAPEELRNRMVTVQKAYLNGNVGASGVVRKVGDDNFFLPSVAEVATNLVRNIPSTADGFDYTGLKQEGDLYAYWAALEIGSTQESFRYLAKRIGNDGEVTAWGARSCYRGIYNNYMVMSADSPWNGEQGAVYVYISPCFAL